MGGHIAYMNKLTDPKEAVELSVSDKASLGRGVHIEHGIKALVPTLRYTLCLHVLSHVILHVTLCIMLQTHGYCLHMQPAAYTTGNIHVC